MSDIRYYKYPRTPHLPWSFSKADDDRVLDSDVYFKEMHSVICTIKMDGENTTVYPDGRCHARSVDSKHRSYHSWLLKDIQRWCYYLPESYHVCGEYLYAKHSIYYDDLESYFYGFSLWNQDLCCSWADTMKFFKDVGIIRVPVVYKGKYDAYLIREIAQTVINAGDEGIVIRNADSFSMVDFSKNVAKCVRPNHVQTDEHWSTQQITKNLLRAGD